MHGLAAAGHALPEAARSQRAVVIVLAAVCVGDLGMDRGVKDTEMKGYSGGAFGFGLADACGCHLLDQQHLSLVSQEHVGAGALP